MRVTPLSLAGRLVVPAFPRMDEYFGLWAMEPGRFAARWDAIQRIDLAAHVAANSANPPKPRAAVELVPGRAGQKIAVIRVLGELMKQQSSMGGTSTIQLRRDIRQAAANEDVGGILLAIDSPGGTVAGTDDLAREVKAARRRKTVWAQIEDLGASAAYWVASQADAVYANSPTALVGSIGTVLALYDMSAAAEKQGVRAMVFRTGPLKAVGQEGERITEEQTAHLQAIVDQVQKSFDAAIKAGRKLTDNQLADVRSGAIYTAEEALSRKLLDGIRPLDATLSELASAVRPRASATTTKTFTALGTLPAGHILEARIMNFEQWLAAKGFDVELYSEQQLATLRSAFEAEQNPPPIAKPVVQAPAPVIAGSVTGDNSPEATFERTQREHRRAQAAETRRIKDIRQVCQEFKGIEVVNTVDGVESREDLESHAIENCWSKEQTELFAMREERKKPKIDTRQHGHRTPFASAEVLEAAILRGRNLPNIEQRFKAETLEAVDRQFRGGIGLQQLLLLAASQNGYQCHPGARVTNGNLREVLQYAFPPAGSPLRAAGFSTVSLPGILGNVANKEILAGYMEEDQTWREMAVIKSVGNFYAVTSYRMLDSMEYEEVGPSGEIKHGSVDQESYTRQAKTYAKMFALTRRDIVNDDLGAFDDLRARIGRGSAKKLNNVFWTAFLSNSSFFTTARGNYITGATTTLLTDGVGLELGIKAFRQMKTATADGAKRIGGQPDRMFVPPELEFAAQRLYQSTNIVSGDTASKGDANIHVNKYRPIVVPWLSDSNFTGYSATAWYLMRNPTVAPAMVVSFLDGNQTPTVDSADADFDVLGVQYRGYHDFGADQAEYVSGVKSKGAA